MWLEGLGKSRTAYPFDEKVNNRKNNIQFSINKPSSGLQSNSIKFPSNAL